MTDQDLRRVILDAVPPLPSPPDRIQSIARRVRRERRRVVVVSVAAGAAVVVGSVAAFGMAAAPGRPPLAIPSPTPSFSPTPDVSPSASVGGVRTETAASMVRIKAAVDASLHRAAPGTTITKRFPVQYMNSAGDIGYNVGQLITTKGRRGYVIVTIQLRSSTEPVTCATEVAPDRQPQCEDKTGPHGEHIVSLPFTGDGPGNRTHVVRLKRTDGTIVTVECGNATKMDVPIGTSHDGTTDFGINTSSHTGKNPPLTIEQVTALALDTSITLYP
jgi:hypothetical protein